MGGGLVVRIDIGGFMVYYVPVRLMLCTPFDYLRVARLRIHAPTPAAATCKAVQSRAKMPDMTINLTDELIKSILQLMILGILGGLVTWFFSHLQKNREIQLQLLHDYSRLHGHFVSLRYEYNSFYIERDGKRSAKFHPLTEEEMRQERWKYFQKACGLIGEIQALKPLISEVFPDTHDDINFCLESVKTGDDI